RVDVLPLHAARPIWPARRRRRGLPLLRALGRGGRDDHRPRPAAAACTGAAGDDAGHPHPLRPRPGVRRAAAARPDRGGDQDGARVTEVLFPPVDDTDPDAEGVLATWYVADGDRVARGQLIAEVQVAKVDAEVVAPVDGTVRLLVGEDEAVRQGLPIARIE